eukprot:1675933-Amphidinium_carterae.1
MGANRRLPTRVREEECYLVFFDDTADNFFSEAELKSLAEEALVMARTSFGVLAASVEVAEPANRSMPLTHRLSRKGTVRDKVWVAIEEVGSVVFGQEVEAPDVHRGDRGISKLSNGAFICCQCIAFEKVAEFIDRRSKGATGCSDDARVLTVQTGATGRHRDWYKVVEGSEEEPFSDFPLAGPRTAGWCLNFLRKRHTPTDHHLFFKTTAKLQSDAWGISEHENLMRLLELGGCYDQLDLANNAWAEAAFRRAQTIEWTYHDGVRESESGASDRLSPE